MRNGSWILALAVAGALALPGPPASAVDMGTFYESLSPYGEWVEMPDYGWSWAPRVDRDWRPYTRGQWVMTDYGWYWDSDEDFGWAAYHYGRWVNDRSYGWVWVPGTEWAPAWVSWRHGNGYTGWAPLPPRATWRTHDSLDIDAFLGARDYVFVRDRAFVDRGIYQQVLPPTQNVTIIHVTENVTRYTFVGQRIVGSGLDVATVERALGRRVPRLRAVDVSRHDAARRAQAGEVAVYRPEVRAAPGRRPAQGRSLVRGEEPPPLLVERRKQRVQEQQQRGDQPDLSAKDVAQKLHPGRPPQSQLPPRAAPSAQQERAEQQDANRQRATEQNQQRLDREKQAGDQRQQTALAGKPAKDAPQEAKANAKDKGKGKHKPVPSPTPPPAEEKQ